MSQEKKIKGGLVVFRLLIIIFVFFFCGCKKPSNVWYVEPEFEKEWRQITGQISPPQVFREIHAWEGTEYPKGPGILIASKPWPGHEKVRVYNRLSMNPVNQGAVLLALDPWMIFSKYKNQPLTASRIYPEAGGSGLLLMAGKDADSVQAWTARLVQGKPGEFPDDPGVWQNAEEGLFSGNRFQNGAQSYNWQDVLFRLMGNESAWVYAPLSAIRRYPNPNKSILEAYAFPERAGGGQYSLQAALLWVLPLGSAEEKEELAQTLEWLKKPETQTIIANAIDWIPADPYGKPYDPVSLTSHRNWLTAPYVYEVNE